MSDNRIKKITEKYVEELLALEGTREELVKEAMEARDGVATYALSQDRYGNTREDIFANARIEYGIEEDE